MFHVSKVAVNSQAKPGTEARRHGPQEEVIGSIMFPSNEEGKSQIRKGQKETRRKEI